MHDPNPSGGQSGIARLRALVLATIIVAGAGLTYWTIRQADHNRREDLVSQARFVSRAVDIQRTVALSGTDDGRRLRADNRRLKAQLAATRAFIPGCERIVLVGRREDGTPFLISDSRPAEAGKAPSTANASSIRQPEEGIFAAERHALDEAAARVTGPFSNRRGRWIRVQIPVIAPHTGNRVAVLRMDFAAGDWPWRRIETAIPMTLLTLVSGRHYDRRRTEYPPRARTR